MKYVVTRQSYITDTIEIDANSSDEAIDKAINEINDIKWKIIATDDVTFDAYIEDEEIV